MLSDLCQSLLDASIHATSQEVQVRVPALTLDVVTEAYGSRFDAAAAAVKLAQNVALQLHFDVQFVLHLMATREDSEDPKFRSVLANFERHIDPFDFSVFSPHMAANVKRTVVRNQTLFGPLIPSHQFALLASMKGALPSGGGGGSFTNAMVTSESVIRFPLLPIVQYNASNSTAHRAASILSGSLVDTNPASHLKRPKAVAATAGSNTVVGRKRDKSPAAVRAAAGSFFEAMSSSWFGGK